MRGEERNIEHQCREYTGQDRAVHYDGILLGLRDDDRDKHAVDAYRECVGKKVREHASQKGADNGASCPSYYRQDGEPKEVSGTNWVLPRDGNAEDLVRYAVGEKYPHKRRHGRISLLGERDTHQGIPEVDYDLRDDHGRDPACTCYDADACDLTCGCDIGKRDNAGLDPVKT